MGARLFARRLGKADVRGVVTWAGPSKFGNGYRYKIRADDGSSHWVDDKDLTVEDDPAAADALAIRKGTNVVVTGGEHAGVEGEVYIAGSGGRFGIRDDDEQTYWVDEKHLERA